MKIIGIKTQDGFFITDDLENKSYYNNSTPLLRHLINGETPQQTFNKRWVKVSSEPKKVQIYTKQPSINHRFEIIDKSLSDKFKPIWVLDEARRWDGEDYVYTDGFIPALYEQKSDEQPDILKDLDFEYDTITEINVIKTPETFSYERAGQWDREKYNNITDKDIKYDMISQIITPEILLNTQPCRLGAKESYDIVRKYIKQNINYDVAEITSDYDFCFTVKKKIYLYKPHPYNVLKVSINIFF